MIRSVPIDYASISSTLSSSSSTPSLCELRGAVRLNYPFESEKSYSLDFLGSCNGLVCFKISRVDKVDDVWTHYFSILNPFTREFKEFGMPRNTHQFTCGFGYDSNTDDYKLVAISDTDGFLHIDVYTMKSDSWKSIKGTINYSSGITGNRPGVFFNGALHWFGSKTTQKTSSEFIVCFDISNETMVNMPLPENVMPPKDFWGDVLKILGVWGDRICVAFAYDCVRLDVWVMQEYGVKESWYRKYTTTQVPWPSHEVPFWKPLLCFDSGVILLDTRGRYLLLFDPKTERVRSVVVRDITTMYSKRECYFETIASLGSSLIWKGRLQMRP